jgi:hypothetical protein
METKKVNMMTRAIASNLPIEQLEELRPMFKTFAKVQGKRLRIRFRGPRRDTMRLYCLKRNAVRFSVYID